jgi:hypothetical protein
MITTGLGGIKLTEGGAGLNGVVNFSEESFIFCHFLHFKKQPFQADDTQLYMP